MNLVSFLKKVEELNSSIAELRLKAFIMEYARVLEEEKREAFLAMFESFEKDPIEIHEQNTNGDDSDFRDLQEKLQEIQDEKRILICEINEDYDDWRDDDEDLKEFIDKDNVIEIVYDAMSFIHGRLDQERYEDAYEIVKLLSELKVRIEGDYYWDEEYIDLKGLRSERVFGDSYERSVAEAGYVAYQCNKMADRPIKIYDLLEKLAYRDVTLENILQAGYRKLEDIDQFILKWIEFLCERSGNDSKRYLKEAYQMLDDRNMKANYAKKYAENHPELFDMLIEDVNDDQEKIELGLSAMDLIPLDRKIRSKIALSCSKNAEEAGDIRIRNKFYAEAFYSNTNSVNYLRCRLKLEDFNDYRKSFREYYQKLNKYQKQNNYVYRDEVNSLNSVEYYTICFFDERFEEVISYEMKQKSYLGWSSTFMKQGLALFLMLLYQGSELTMPICKMVTMFSNPVSFVKEYFIEDEIAEDSVELVWDLFMRWKSDVVLDEKKREEWLRKIRLIIRNRTQAILGGNYRNYYWECAAYISAYGDVIESMNLGRRKDLILIYLKEYPRHSNFHHLMKQYL
ncbi:MAG: hypothetical protein IJI46_03130 [Erysipelotrichaceae bacterium]|nr:hypothetical protein [Erysipelotrichaceae bacterium]